VLRRSVSSSDLVPGQMPVPNRLRSLKDNQRVRSVPYPSMDIIQAARQKVYSTDRNGLWIFVDVLLFQRRGLPIMGLVPSVFMPGYVSCSGDDLRRLTGGILYDRMIGERFREKGWDVKYFDIESMPRFMKFLKFPSKGFLQRRSDSFDILLTDLGNSTIVMGFQKWASRRGMLTAMICHHFRSGLEKTALRRLLYRFSEKSVVRSADLLIANSMLTMDTLLSMGRKRQDMVLAPPGLQYSVAESRSVDGKPSEILAVCSIEPRKGILEMIRALHSSGLDGARLTIVGELDGGSVYARRVAGLIEDLQMESRVRLSGKLDDQALKEAYEKADVFMLLSKWEGYGMSIAEAMAHGLPVLTTNAGAIPQLVKHGVSGLMVDPHDWPKAGEYLKALFGDRDLRARLSRSALESAVSFPTWDDTTEAVFEAVRARYDSSRNR
jgi:glycosyltransferase involved in cell wall biosynthesis